MLRNRFPGLAIAGAVIAAAAARASDPPEIMPIDEWVEKHRYVAAESGSAHPGRWSNTLTPYAIKPMQVMSIDHPSKRVAVSASAQTLKSELELNVIFAYIDMAPGVMMLVLPSGDEVTNWNATKWRPNLKATHRIRDKVVPERARDENASTGARKEFLGGKLHVVSAGSSKGLQAKSVRVIFYDEVSEFPEDTGDRGHAIDQARHRQDGQGDDTKELAASTPKELPSCRITKMVEEGTLDRYYIPCPTCGHYQRLVFDNFKFADGAPYFACASNGCAIEETQKHGFLQYGFGGKVTGAAEWLPCFQSENPDNPPPPDHFPPEDLGRWLARDTEGREPSFHIWQAYSTLKPWAKIAAEWREAQGDATKLKVFWQQVLAEPFDAGGDAPAHEKLLARRDPDFPMGGVPFGYWIVTAGADIQVDRIEATAWAWAPGMGSFLVAREVFPGKTSDEFAQCWKDLGEFRMRTFPGENGYDFPIDLMTVDSGHERYIVYKFCNGRANTLAVRGTDDRNLAPLGAPAKIKRAPARPGRKARPAALLYPVGSYGLKSQLYHGLRALEDLTDEDLKAKAFPAGCVRLPADITEADVKQLVSEYLAPEKKSRGRTELAWHKKAGQPNEMLDMYCYARAAAFKFGAGAMKNEQWESLAANRGGAGEKDVGGLEKMWSAAGMKEAPSMSEQALKPKPSASGQSPRRSFMQRQGLGLKRGFLKS